MKQSTAHIDANDDTMLREKMFEYHSAGPQYRPRWIRTAVQIAFYIALLSSFSSVPAAAQTPEDAQFFDSNGVQIRYIDKGTGDPVLLMHGFTSRIESWEQRASSLDWSTTGSGPSLMTVEGTAEVTSPVTPSSTARKTSRTRSGFSTISRSDARVWSGIHVEPTRPVDLWFGTPTGFAASSSGDGPSIILSIRFRPQTVKPWRIRSLAGRTRSP